jgi:hypothetical protein
VVGAPLIWGDSGLIRTKNKLATDLESLEALMKINLIHPVKILELGHTRRLKLKVGRQVKINTVVLLSGVFFTPSLSWIWTHITLLSGIHSEIYFIFKAMSLFNCS